MILKYQKAIATSAEENKLRAEGSPIVELATIGHETYVYIPPGTVLLDQPAEITKTLERVRLTQEVMMEIISTSPWAKKFLVEAAE